MVTMPIDVCITFDIEFDINGAFENPGQRQPVGSESLRCWDGERDLGLCHLLKTLASYDLKATFFVEALNISYFGDQPMGDIAREIHNAGHDVELHLHPVWTVFDDPDWANRVKRKPPCAGKDDSLGARSTVEVRELVERGLEAFARWGLPRPVSVRAGNLAVGPTIYEALAELEIPMASNVGYALFQPEAEEFHLYWGRHWFGGVLEIPVTSYLDLRMPFFKHWKLATLIGMGRREMRMLLERAERVAATPLVFLSHVSEFVRRPADDYNQFKPNQGTCQRFDKLCRFLAENQDRFRTTTFREAMDDWSKQPSSDNRSLNTPIGGLLARLLERIVES